MQTQKPTLINVIAWTTLASGIVNIGWGIAAFTTFIGVICAPLSILPIILGVFELIYAAKLLSTPTQPVSPSTNLAIFEILAVLYGNVFAMVVGILSLVFYNDQIVRDYFNRLNGSDGSFSPVPVPPAPPAPIVDPIPYPIAPEEPVVPEPEAPDKPKRPRKVAGE